VGSRGGPAREPRCAGDGDGRLSCEGQVVRAGRRSGSDHRRAGRLARQHPVEGASLRIDIAKRTLTKLTGETIPAGTPFALRVIGRGSDSCESDLHIPFAPLDRGAAALKLATLQAKNNARTPIDAGGGRYFDARDAKGLSNAFTQAVRPAFELVDAQKNVAAKGLVGGDPVRVLPGTYTVTVKGRQEPARSVTVRPRETSTVTY
jgi:hypothetical protein